MSWQIDGSQELLSIADVRERVGVSARTLRYYEELGLLPGVRRTSGGRRVYAADEIERLRFIQRLKQFGLSLAEVKELNAVYAIAGSTRDMLARLREQLDAHCARLDAHIAELEDLRAQMVHYRGHVARRISEFGARADRQRSS